MAGERTIKVRFDGDSSGLRAAAVSGERAISGLDDGVKTTTTSLGKSGVAAQRTAADFGVLDRSLTAVSASIRATQEEIVKTGNTRLFGDLRKQESEFKKLANLRKVFEDEGPPAAKGFFAAFSGQIGPLFARLPISGPMAAALGAAAVVAAPLIGSALGAAVIGGGGGLGIVGGALVAARDARVKSAYSDLADDIGTELRSAAEPFVPALLDAADKGRAGFARVRDDVRSIFADSSRLISPLIDGAVSGVERIIHGVRDLVSSADGAGPVFREIGNAVSIIGDAVGDVLTDMSDDGDEAAGAIRGLALAVGEGIRGVGAFIEVTTAALRPMVDLALGAANVSEALWGWMPVIGDRIRSGRDNILDMKAAMDGTAGATDTATRAVQAQGTAAYSTAQAVDLLTAAQNRQAGIAMNAAEANLQYRSAVNAAKEATDQKRAVSIGEEQALLGLIRAANAASESMDASGTSTKQATAAFNSHRAQVISSARAMGMSESQAKAYADRLLTIPKAVNTKIVLDSQQAISGARNIQREIGKIKGKTVTINIRQTGEYGEEGLGAQHGPGRRAWGGPVFSGRQYLVGENGPEILTMGAGGSGFVTPNGAAAPGGFNGTLVVELDGQPFYAYSVRTANQAVDDYAHKQKAGKR